MKKKWYAAILAVTETGLAEAVAPLTDYVSDDVDSLFYKRSYDNLLRNILESENAPVDLPLRFASAILAFCIWQRSMAKAAASIF